MSGLISVRTGRRASRPAADWTNTGLPPCDGSSVVDLRLLAGVDHLRVMLLYRAVAITALSLNELATGIPLRLTTCEGVVVEDGLGNARAEHGPPGHPYSGPDPESHDRRTCCATPGAVRPSQRFTEPAGNACLLCWPRRFSPT